MRKKVLFTLTALFAAIASLTAAPVTKAEASEMAKAFMMARGIAVEGDLTLAESPKRNAPAKDGAASYYVFNNGEDGGFVIMSGDTRTRQILAYSDEGHFDMNCIEGTVGDLLEDYEQQIEMLNKVGMMETRQEGMAKLPTPTTSPVQPLLTSKWNQSSPYNNTCPCYSGTSRSAVGCVGVSMAQYVYYFRNRMDAKLSTTIPASTSKNPSPTIKAGFVFNWGSMFDFYDGTQTSSQILAVAELCRICATAINSSFDNSTSASHSKIGPALNSYFNFNISTLVSRESYTYTEWREKLINELQQGRPVLYSARKASSGHSFVLDGFDGGDLFHINWGWGGKNDGFYSLSAFEPDDKEGYNTLVNSSTSYLSNHEAYFNLQPMKGYNSTNELVYLSSIVNSASGSTAKVTYYNNTGANRTYRAGLGCKDANGNVILLKEWTKGEMNIYNGYTTGAVTYTLAVSDFSAKNLKTGTYRVFPVCQLKGENEWKVCDPKNTYLYIKAVYATSKVTLSIGKLQPALTATIETPGSKVKSVKQPVIVTVTNNGEDFYGNIYLFASTTSSKGDVKSTSALAVPAGHSVKVYMNFTPSAAGTFNLWATTNSSGTEVIGSSKCVIVKGTYSRKLTLSSLNIANLSSGKKILGTTFKATCNITNSTNFPYAGIVRAVLYVANGSYVSTTMVKNKFLTFAPNGKDSLVFEFEGLNPSKKYAIAVGYEDGSDISGGWKYGYSFSNAVLTYYGPDNMVAIAPASKVTIPNGVLAVDLSNTTGTVKTIVPNNNPNTIYFMGEKESVSGLSGKNYVKGTTASTITLQDGYAYFTPKRFTAQKISYSRLMTIGTGGSGGWQTIVMPFAASTVTCNGQELRWFKSGSDTNAHFWIKDFSALNGNTVCFGYVDELKANHPYLMAVPNEKWPQSNLVGKTLVFNGENAVLDKDPIVMTGSELFNYRGTYIEEKMDHIYVMNSTGSKFVYGTYTVKPFRCYFIKSNLDPTDVNDLNIGSFDETNDIFMPVVEENDDATVDVYNLSGVKVGKANVSGSQIELGDLPKGIYVVKGKKVIKY
jgi:hypothetical protein